MRSGAIAHLLVIAPSHGLLEETGRGKRANHGCAEEELLESLSVNVSQLLHGAEFGGSNSFS